MAGQEKIPVTPAVRVLRAMGVAFEPYFYPYEEKGGAPHAAEALGLPLHQVVKTIVFEDEAGKNLIVLQHGDRDTSTQALSRRLGVKRLRPASPQKVLRLTGYKVGGTSPFGMRASLPLYSLPIYMEASIGGLSTIYVNGGKRGFLVGISPNELQRLLKPQLVTVAIAKSPVG